MRKLILSSLFTLLGISSLLALDASLSFARFSSPAYNYVELYLHISGQTVQSTAVNDSMVQGAVKVLVIFEQDGEVKQFDKFQLSSPFGKRVVDFIDVKRYTLDNGEYLLRVEVEDANNPEMVRKYQSPIHINFEKDKLLQSDIQLLASVSPTDENGPMVKNGIKMEPLPFNFYGRGANVLAFYHEIYNSDSQINDSYLVSYIIEKIENGEARRMLIRHKRQEPQGVNPILERVDISKIPSGNYQLTVEVRNREKALLSSQTTLFQRSNPIEDAIVIEQALAQVKLEEEFVNELSNEELVYSIKAITAIAPPADITMINDLLKNKNVRGQKMYLYGFWLKENKHQPKAAYESYMEVARAVDDMFQSGFRNGFETDRGYIYLKYGQPSDITRNEQEPSAPPYEIWSYNTVEETRQNNVRFIFYNPSLAADDFILLHSDVRGERSNPNWQTELYRDAPGEHPQDYFMGQDVQDNTGRRSRRLLNDY